MVNVTPITIVYYTYYIVFMGITMVSGRMVDITIVFMDFTNTFTIRNLLYEVVFMVNINQHPATSSNTHCCAVFEGRVLTEFGVLQDLQVTRQARLSGMARQKSWAQIAETDGPDCLNTIP